MSNLWKQRVGFVGLFGVYYMYTLHANLMESRPLAAPVSTLHDYQPSADYPSKQQPLESAIARPSSLSLSSSASVPLNSPNVKAADAEAPPFAVAPTAVVHHSTSTFNATKLAPGAVTTRDSSWSGTYKCYDYGETFAASFLCHVDAFKGMKKYRSVLKSHRAAHACHYITWTRQPAKTVDALDFFVEHLSAYERRLNLGKLKHNFKFQEQMKNAVASALSTRLASYAGHHFVGKAAQLNYLDPSLLDQEDNDRVLGLIPYYGEGMGKGQAQSSLNTRKAYLEATYWSIRALTSRVVVAVCTDADALFVESLVDEVFAPALKARRAAQGLVGAANQRQMNAGFPVLTLLRFNLQGPQSLPVAAVGFLVRTANREGKPSHPWSYEALPRRPSPGTSTISGPVKDWVKHLADARGGLHSSSSSSSAVAPTSGSVWEKVKHLLYTEADQIVHLRAMAELLPTLTATDFAVPHRMIPMPTRGDFQSSAEVMEKLQMIQEDSSLDQSEKGEGFSRLLDLLDVNDAKQAQQVAVYPPSTSPSSSSSSSRDSNTKCCMDMANGGNCTIRDHWVGYLGEGEGIEEGGSVASTDEMSGSGAQLLRVGGSPLGLAFVAGEGNVQHNPPTIRRCTLHTTGDICPKS